ncbi:MAG: unsaturated rhamnogalacturonyl hydrolase, partial [Pirellulaceae bacterium]
MPRIYLSSSIVLLSFLCNLVAVSGEQFFRHPIGATDDHTPIVCWQDPQSLDFDDSQLRIVVVAGLDDQLKSTEAGRNIASSFAAGRRKGGITKSFTLSVIEFPINQNPSFPPRGVAYNNPNTRESHYVWRWLGTHGADLVIDLRSGDSTKIEVPENATANWSKLAKALPQATSYREETDLPSALLQAKPCGLGTIPALRITCDPQEAAKVVDSLMHTLASANYRVKSEVRTQLELRVNRSALQVATQLSQHYGKDLSQVVYIPAVALIARVRLAEITGEPEYLAQVKRAVKEYFDGGRPTTPKSGSGLSGHLIFGELAAATSGKERARYIELARNASDLMFNDDGTTKPAMPFHSEMSDALFMGGPILAQVGNLSKDKRYYEACRIHIDFMRKLVLRNDMLYRHSPLDEAAWGRGNGFPALGLALCLDAIPESEPSHKVLLGYFQQHMRQLAQQQDETGPWHEVIDSHQTYRELTSTCMIAYAMTRGIRRGWLSDAGYKENVARAWEGIKRRVGANGELIDVCTGTGKQKNLDAYFNRTAMLGKDGRGGAMAMLVAT